MTETGSSSVQIAFPVDEVADPAKHTYSVDIEGKTMSVYEYSYLCYGEAEALRRFHAKLVKVFSLSHLMNIFVSLQNRGKDSISVTTNY